jgi:predicted dehydrogenase
MSKISRRSFLQKAGVGLAGFTILPSLSGLATPSDRLRVAHIGINGMGNNHMNWFAALPDVEIAALCDVEELHLNQAFDSLKKLKPDTKAKRYGDFRKVLDDKNIDAITIATPDHWHATIAILAFQAGKDVYGEKPLSYDVKEGQMMLKALEKNKRVFQLGTQIHAGDNYHRVVEIIKSGVIGDIKTVRLWKTGGTPPLNNTSVQTPPKSLNYDMWLGPAPKVEYIPDRVHFNYRYFLDYSGGVFADFWCHISDIVWWAIQPKGLSSISAKGEKSDGIADAPKWLDAEFQFEGLKMYWTSESPKVEGADKRHIGAYFEGTKGTLICDYSSFEVRMDGQLITDLQTTVQVPRSPGHQQNFVDAVKSRKPPESNLAYVRDMTLPMHLALASYRLKRELKWDAKKEICISDAEANQMLSRKSRKEWDLIGKG